MTFSLYVAIWKSEVNSSVTCKGDIRFLSYTILIAKVLYQKLARFPMEKYLRTALVIYIYNFVYKIIVQLGLMETYKTI